MLRRAHRTNGDEVRAPLLLGLHIQMAEAAKGKADLSSLQQRDLSGLSYSHLYRSEQKGS